MAAKKKNSQHTEKRNVSSSDDIYDLDIRESSDQFITVKTSIAT